MKTIDEWAEYHEETTEPGYFPEVVGLVLAIRKEFRQACVVQIEAQKCPPGGDEYAEGIWNDALSDAITAIKEIGI